MRIEHVALWTADLERSRQFYCDYFGAVAGERYDNPVRRFSSYFLRFPEGGARLELMTMPDAQPAAEMRAGYAHLAVSVGSVDAVDGLTARLTAAGYAKIDGPRWTGDGYYEAVVLDPDGNRVEITV